MAQLYEISHRLTRLLASTVLGMALMGVAIPAAATPSADCEAMAEEESRRAGLPPGLLVAISRIESGRAIGKGKVRAWQWTLNQAGKGMYFDTKKEAMAYLTKAVNSGVRNIDVGCMQINYRWHHKEFTSLENMMNPRSNVKYAVRFMLELKRRFGTWEAATRNYHSADGTRGASYYKKVARVWKGLAPAEAIVVADASGGEQTKIVARQANWHDMTSRRATGPLVVLPTISENEGLYAAAIALVAGRNTPDIKLDRPKPTLLANAPRALRRKWLTVQSFRTMLAGQ